VENFPPDPVSKSPEDFVELVRRHSPKIFGLALRLCGNPVDGEDLAQETFIAAYRRFDQFRGDARFRVLGLPHLREPVEEPRALRKTPRVLEAHTVFSAAATGTTATPSPWTSPIPGTSPTPRRKRRNAGGGCGDAIAGLHPEERAALVLREMEDKSYEEIAELLGVPLGTVKSRIARARQAVKARLAPFLGEKP
jgi:RNA polymerase sigma-70 factor (ECF subfamily)